MKVYKPEWRCTLNVKEGVGNSAGWKQRLAWRLRALADRLDGGGRTVKVDYEISPNVSREEVDVCLTKGFAVSQRLLTELAQQAACEAVMRNAKAELFDGEEATGPKH